MTPWLSPYTVKIVLYAPRPSAALLRVKNEGVWEWDSRSYMYMYLWGWGSSWVSWGGCLWCSRGSFPAAKGPWTPGEPRGDRRGDSYTHTHTHTHTHKWEACAEGMAIAFSFACLLCQPIFASLVLRPEGQLDRGPCCSRALSTEHRCMQMKRAIVLKRQ